MSRKDLSGKQRFQRNISAILVQRQFRSRVVASLTVSANLSFEPVNDVSQMFNRASAWTQDFTQETSGSFRSVPKTQRRR